jgi:hypothetical protein
MGLVTRVCACTWRSCICVVLYVLRASLNAEVGSEEAHGRTVRAHTVDRAGASTMVRIPRMTVVGGRWSWGPGSRPRPAAFPPAD